METLLKILEMVFGKIAPLPLCVVALVTGFSLFGPEHLIGSTFQLADFRNANRQWISMAFLISVTYLLVYVAYWCWQKLMAWWTENKETRRIRDRLHELTYGEKEILAQFIIQQSRVIEISSQNTAMTALSSEGIIRTPGQITELRIDRDTRRGYHILKVQIHDFAWLYLSLHPKLLEPGGTPALAKG